MAPLATTIDDDEAVALRFAHGLGSLLPLFRPVLHEAETFWPPDQPPAVVLLSSLGRVFAGGFDTLSGMDRAAVMGQVERGMAGGADHLGTAVATGFLEALIYKAEADGIWPLIETALGLLSLGFAVAYRSDLL